MLRLTRKAPVLVRVLPTFSGDITEKVVRRKWKSPLVDCTSCTPEGITCIKETDVGGLLLKSE
jgi:hypothetical protein